MGKGASLLGWQSAQAMHTAVKVMGQAWQSNGGRWVRGPEAAQQQGAMGQR